MSIKIFDKTYKACSNLFVETIEEQRYTYPAPILIYGTIESESKNTKNNLELKFNSYYDSILTINSYFNLFFYILDFEYKLSTMYFKNILKSESNSEMYGYKGSYVFTEGNILMNVIEDNIYNDYNKIKTKLQD